jgi:class 3 adenylate cyclase
LLRCSRSCDAGRAADSGTQGEPEKEETKRDIVFHGDVMNTAARLEHATRELDRHFLVSADALNRLTASDRYELEPLGRRGTAFR